MQLFYWVSLTSGQQHLNRHPVLSLLRRLFQSIQETISIICRLTVPLSDDQLVIIVSWALIRAENAVSDDINNFGMQTELQVLVQSS